MIDAIKAKQAEFITVFVRVSFGLLWLQGASWKMLPRFGLDAKDNLYYWVSLSVQYPVWRPYTAFTENVILPHFLFFAWSIFLSEIAIGLALILGIRVRWFVVYALFMTLNISLTVLNTPGEWPWSYALMAMVGLMLFAYPQKDSVLSFEYWARTWLSKKN